MGGMYLFNLYPHVFYEFKQPLPMFYFSFKKLYICLFSISYCITGEKSYILTVTKLFVEGSALGKRTIAKWTQ